MYQHARTLNISNNLTSFFKNKFEILNKNFSSYFEINTFFGEGLFSGLKIGLDNAFYSAVYNSDLHFQKNLLFIPSMEMLSIYKGFISSYEKRENSFDGTFYNLSKALNALPLKKQDNSAWLKLLEDSFNGKVIRKDEEFYIKFDKLNKEIPANLTASGVNKLAQMAYLIINGSLNKDTVLLWDEPETNLNPLYIKIVAKFLQTLAKNGVQIFVATHDYLLAHLLSLDAEYSHETAAPPMKFFSFYKGEDGTKIEAADTIAGLQHNALLDEYAAYYDLEQALFRKSMQNV